MITKRTAKCRHAWEDANGKPAACYECVVRLAERLIEYRDHHEFVVGQIGQAIGKEVKTAGDVLDELKRLQAIVDRLARWSKRWGRNTHHSGTSMEACNAELYAIEDAAIAAAEKARKP